MDYFFNFIKLALLKTGGIIMKTKFIVRSILTLVIFFAFTLSGYANKTGVKIVAPEKVKKGTEVTVKIEVSHFGNSKGHYTDWVVVKVNGEEFKRWEYKPDSLPEDQNFILEFTITADKNLEIIAEGNCNKHGSKGDDKVTIVVE